MLNSFHPGLLFTFHFSVKVFVLGLFTLILVSIVLWSDPLSFFSFTRNEPSSSTILWDTFFAMVRLVSM